MSDLTRRPGAPQDDHDGPVMGRPKSARRNAWTPTESGAEGMTMEHPPEDDHPGIVIVDFTYEHCGEHVSRAGNGRARNHCPVCLWSKHVGLGEQVGCPPCGAMMRGTDVGNEEVVCVASAAGWVHRRLHAPRAGDRRAPLG